MHWLSALFLRRVQIFASCAPEECIEALATRAISKGYGNAGITRTSATFTKETGPNGCTGCLLLLLGIIPGVVYFALARGQRSLSVSASVQDEKTRLVFTGTTQNDGICV